MVEYKIVRLKERPELKEEAAIWFHDKWGVPIDTYIESMDASLSGDKIQEWYLCLSGEKIISGMGEIENDFHSRKDLAPWRGIIEVQSSNTQNVIESRKE